MELGPAERTRVAERSMERLRHLERLIRDMLLFARGDSLGRQHFKVCELTAELAHVLEPVARARQVRFTEDCECDDATLFGDRKALAGALTNLLENAVQATPTGGSVSLGAALEGAEVSFRVSDTGCGMDAALQERIFQPSSPPAQRGPASASPSRVAWRAATAATSPSSRHRAEAPPSP